MKPHIKMIDGMWHCLLDENGFSIGMPTTFEAYDAYCFINFWSGGVILRNGSDLEKRFKENPSK